ncbi:MAG: MMPL family transporter [Planctomycetes bacterium]|nr:MMPL family transporter [Planctomycetota bacterium]
MSSSLSRGLERLVDFLTRRPGISLAILLGLAALSAFYAASSIEIQGGRDQLISPDEEYFRHYVSFKERFGHEEFLIAILEVEDRARAAAAAEELARTLEAQVGTDLQAVYARAPGSFFRDRGLLYAPEDRFDAAARFCERLGEIVPEVGLAAILEAVLSEMGRVQKGEFGETDLEFLVRLFRWLERSLEGRPGDPSVDDPFLDVSEPDPLEDYFTSADGRLVLLFAVPARRSGRLQEARGAIETVRGAIEKTRQRFPEQRIGLTGRPAVDSDEMATATADMTRSTVLSFFGVAILFAFAFRSPLRTAAALVTLAVGIAWTFGIATLWPGRLNLLSCVFVVMLVGLGIDFSVYLLARFERERAAGLSMRDATLATLRAAGKASLVGAVTTSLAFYTALLIDFRGLAELGFIAGTGILLCLASAATVLPALLAWLEARRPEGSPRAPSGPWKRDPFRGRTASGAILVVSAAALALSLPAWTRLDFDFNPTNLQARGLESVEYERKLVLGSNRATWFGVSIVDRGGLEALAARRDAFDALPEIGRVESILDALPPDQDGRLAKLRELAAKLPPTNPSRLLPAIDPTACLRLLEEIRKDVRQKMDDALGTTDAAAAIPALERLEAAVVSSIEAHRAAGVDLVGRYESFQEKLDREIQRRVEILRKDLEVERVKVRDLPPFYREVFVGRDGSYCLHVHPQHDPTDPEVLERFVSDATQVDPAFTGAPVQFFHTSRLIRDGFVRASFYALGAIVLVVLVSLRRPLDALFSLLPLALGLSWLVALMELLDLRFNLANFFAVPILIGIGVDAGVHFVARFREDGNAGGAWRLMARSILVAAATTILGFGTLILAHHRGVASLGLVMVLGCACQLAASLATLPALLRLMERRRTP